MGRRSTRPTGAVEPLMRLERSLREVGAPERLARLDRAWRVARGAASAGDGGVVPQYAVVGRDGVVVIGFDGPVGDPPSRWTASAADRWSVGPEIATRDLVPDVAALRFPSPALVQLGHHADGDVFVDVEAFGWVGVEGPERDCRRVVRAIVSSLGVSPFAEAAELVVEARPEDELPAGPGWERVDGPDGLESLPCELAASIRAYGLGDGPLFVRPRPPEEPWSPTILVRTGGSGLLPTTGPLANPLRVPTNGSRVDGPRIVTISTGVADPPAQLVRGQRGWRFEPSGIELVPIGLEREHVAAVRSLLEAAGEPISENPEVGVITPVTATVDGDPPWTFLVRVLGPVDVSDRSGVPVVFDRAKSLELVTWLTLHHGRSSRQAARTALWEMDVRSSTFANVVSEARRALHRHHGAVDEASNSADDWIRRAAGDHLQLHPGVVSDLHLLEVRATQARSMSDADAIGVLWSGVELVRGVPFVESGFHWPDAEGLTSAATLLVVSVVADLAERCLAGGDTDAVFRSTAIGLGVLPGHEELIALRLRAHASRGDHSGVRREWEAYERVLAADRWAGEPSARLVQMRRDLLAPAFAGRAGPD